MQIEGKNAAVYNGGTSQTFNVTKSSLGLDKVNNTADADKSVKYAGSVPWNGVTDKPSSYPPSSHTHTKAQVGLGNVDNTADSAKSVKYAASAGKATNDSAGQNINTTYIKNLAVSGRTITYTKGNGATGTITTQDTNTTYGVASQSSNGLMSAVDKKAIDREFFRMLPKGGTVIPNGANLNSTAYLKVGNYYQPAIANTTNMTNIPIKSAFMMYVLSPLSETYDNESTNDWVRRLRIFIDYTGQYIFTQFVHSETTAGSFSYDPWVKMINSNDLGAVSNTINTHIANKANPHGVTKAQVGLGNVANLDQSKAIKSITRSGTTFTATALDGTTSTFTQQDNNTTYSAGSGLALSGTSFSINQNASTVSYAKNANWANGASYSNYIGGAGVSTNALRDNTCFDFGYEG